MNLKICLVVNTGGNEINQSLGDTRIRHKSFKSLRKYICVKLYHSFLEWLETNVGYFALNLRCQLSDIKYLFVHAAIITNEYI